MSAHENKQLVRRFYDEIVNGGKVERMAEFVTPECVETDGQTRHQLVALPGPRPELAMFTLSTADDRVIHDPSTAEHVVLAFRSYQRGETVWRTAFELRPMEL